MTSTLDDASTPQGSAATLDAVTFEVIRHRLWAINDDQGRMAARLSASTTVYELNDFNAAILTADGRGVCSGAYLMNHATTVQSFIGLLLQRFDLADIHEGDLFYTNDPWCGALHANDGLLALPIFDGDRLVAWSCIVMHDDDVGSPVPSSLVVGATDRFGEAPIFPIFKLGNDFAPREDLMATLLRNSRIPLSNEQNMRARVAALRTAHARIRELIDEYGGDTFVAALEELVAYVVRILRARLREIPDGSWYAQTYHDHDSITDDVHPICVRLTKRGEHLYFDTAGTAPQTPGPVNCTRLCLEGSILGSLLVTLCCDLPWVCGAVREVFDLHAEEGTINTATGAAAVSLGSFMATFSTNDAVASVIARMLLTSSRYRVEAQAGWCGGMSGAAFAVPDANGELTINLALDALGGGGGARTFCDGIDSGGLMESPATRITNVEVFESRAPMLHLYRRESTDSGGPGRFRGGAGLEYAVMPHKAGGPASMATMSAGLAMPAGLALAGGLPSPAATVHLLRGSDVRAQFRRGVVPVGREAIAAVAQEVQAAKARTDAGPDDVYIAIVAGGSGYGDPLRRDPEAVASDVVAGLVSPHAARDAYGVVVSPEGVVDAAATGDVRRAAVARRRVHATVDKVTDESSAAAVLLHPVADAVEAVQTDDGRALRCTVCHHVYGDYAVDYKAVAAMRERELVEVNPQNQHCSADFVLSEFSCPGCGTAVANDVQLRSEAVRGESQFIPVP